MATGKALDGKPYAGNPHVRFDEGEVAPAATPRRGSLLYSIPVSVKGAEGAKAVTARMLSYESDLEQVPVEVKDGKFALAKPDAYSAAFLVTFEF